jgi:hypothetical protein
MHFRRSQVSAAITWGMIPLTFWGVLPGTGCICTSGQYKLFCTGALDRGRCNGGQKTAPASQLAGCACQHCGGASATDSGEGQRACCQSSGSRDSAPGTCCHLIARSPATVSSEVTPPIRDALVVALLPPALDLSLVALPTVSKHVDQIDTGPPVDRVIVLCCLLI